jgi:hypothetical protein
MKSPKVILMPLLRVAFACMMVGCAATAIYSAEPKDIPILQKWSGDYPIVHLNRLPQGQQKSRIGYIGNTATFATVWQAFKPGEKTPEVDFSRNFVVFSRNVDFYNRISIFKITLKDGVIEILAMETRSALPIEDKVAMAIAVIPREGAKFIQAGKERIPIAPSAPSADLLNAIFTIERQEVRLIDGYHEKQAAPGSATKIKTMVFGQPVKGDLDGDGDEDAGLFILHTPGGSGTFYYVAVALNRNGDYRGTNGVLLGDRIAPQTIQISNGVVVANYADRRPDEPMAARPSVGKTKYLTLKNMQLEEIMPLGQGEQVLKGWVTIGHEVRSFKPCLRKTDLWILGESPALRDIIAAHSKAFPDRKRYAPLFMVLAGKYAERPTGGFGRECEGAFLATQLVQVWPKGNCKSALIVVDAPTPGAVITSPLRVQGKARGVWFFEGDFPLLLMDSHRRVIAKGFATAKGEWMTQKFVSFEGILKFKKLEGSSMGTLAFIKDNPTDRPEFDDALEIPVCFK